MDKKEKRKDERLPYSAPLQFTVLPVDESRNPRIEAQGRIIDTSKSGIGIMTTISLEPGHVLTWDDKHEQGKLHIALVKWARELGGGFRAGLMFI
ncbi:MAG: hypothetical protein EPN25_11375 [Nitrospirae bacterium]|nr:MAG: hypothetical protein EPN25_11375 [Nitrospirota bacterium]